MNQLVKKNSCRKLVNSASFNAAWSKPDENPECPSSSNPTDLAKSSWKTPGVIRLKADGSIVHMDERAQILFAHLNPAIHTMDDFLPENLVCPHKTFIKRFLEGGEKRMLDTVRPCRLRLCFKDAFALAHILVTENEDPETQESWRFMCQVWPGDVRTQPQKLLARIMPAYAMNAVFAQREEMSVLDRAKIAQFSEDHRGVAVLMADIARSTDFVYRFKDTPRVVMEMTQRVCQVLEDCALAYGVHKVDFAGDCYTVAEGLEKEKRGNPVRILCKVGGLMAQMAHKVFTDHPDLYSGLGLRIGIGYGPVTSCVFELMQPTLKLFGAPMHSANRAQRGCTVGMLALTEDAYNCLVESTMSSADSLHAGDMTPLGHFCSPELIAAQGIGSDETMHIVQIDPNTHYDNPVTFPHWQLQNRQSTECPAFSL